MDAQGIGSTEYTYTLEELEYLKACIIQNGGSLYSALFAFLDGRDVSEDELLCLWLRHAEGMTIDPDYIGKLKDMAASTTHVEVARQ